MTGIPGKTGVVYTLDRETGEFLWARSTVTQNVISDIDGATGAVTENAELVFSALGQEVLACPTWNGGKDWEAVTRHRKSQWIPYSLETRRSERVRKRPENGWQNRKRLAVRLAFRGAILCGLRRCQPFASMPPADIECPRTLPELLPDPIGGV